MITFDLSELQFALDGDKIKLKAVGGESLHPFVAVNVSGRNKNSHLGVKKDNLSEENNLNYISHKLSGKTFVIVQRNDIIEVKSVFTLHGENTVSAYSEIKNVSGEEITLEEASSLKVVFGENVSPDDLYFTRFSQSHHGECTPISHSFGDWGLKFTTGGGQKKIGFSSVGSWTTKEELPQGIIRCGDKFMMFQIECNSSWNYEISDKGTAYYLYLGGADITFGGWYKTLKPGESYRTITSSLTFGDSLNEVVGGLTGYRREIMGKCAPDECLPPIFNEYMHLSWDNPNEERTRALAPVIQKTGVKYYVIDCGWHDEVETEKIYRNVGRWKESKLRFPHGVRAITDYLRSLGLKAGLWIEPEVVGVENEEMLKYYGDDCFLQRNGKKICVMGRYFLDFRKERVREYMSETIRRMVEDYGADYIKTDYNQDVGIGADNGGTSFGEGLESAANAFFGWIGEMREKFPNVIFEGCASGGMRLDYKTLQNFSIISTSDQIDYLKYPYIAGNVLSAVTPEQAAVWSYPVHTEPPIGSVMPNKEWVDGNISESEVVMNMINGFLGRIHLASRIDLLDEDKFALVKEGVEYYEKLSKIKRQAVPYFPTGLNVFGQDSVKAGLKLGNKIYLAVWCLSGTRWTSVKLFEKIKGAKIAYPSVCEDKLSFEKDVLTVVFKDVKRAVFVEAELEEN